MTAVGGQFAAADVRAYGAKLSELAKWMADQGMPLAYHHHMGAYVESPEDVDHLMAVTDAQSVGLLYDTGHAYFGGAVDPLLPLKKHIKRIVHVHCKDVRPKVIAQSRTDAWSFLTGVIRPTAAPIRNLY